MGLVIFFFKVMRCLSFLWRARARARDRFLVARVFGFSGNEVLQSLRDIENWRCSVAATREIVCRE